MVKTIKSRGALLRHGITAFLLLCSMLFIAGPAQAQPRVAEMLMSMQWAAVTDPDQWLRMLQPLVESTEKILALANELTNSVMKWMGQFGGQNQNVTEMIGQPFAEALNLLKALMQRIEHELISAFKA